MDTKEKNTVLIYVHDPMCSWCWGFVPMWKALDEKIRETYPELIIKRLLGGLAPDSDMPMAYEMQQYLQQIWIRIQQQIPGTEFNFDFWKTNIPKRSSWPACRAVIAARNQGAQYEEQMIRAIQINYYLNARNPSDRQVLIEMSDKLGLNTKRFEKELDAEETRHQHQLEMNEVVNYGIQGFPSLVLFDGKQSSRIGVNYTDFMNMVIEIGSVLDQLNRLSIQYSEKVR